MSTEDIQCFLAQIKTEKEDTMQLIYIIANQDALDLYQIIKPGENSLGFVVLGGVPKGI
jgi:hypothetical protein